MRTGGALHCLVNARTGREQAYAGTSPPQGQRIAVVGAGPAGLTYASLVAAGNDVVVFERRQRAGGALRQAALAPMFQEVAANAGSIGRYIDALEEACRRAGVHIVYGTDVAEAPELLAGYDRIVVATGAHYRAGLGALAGVLLQTGAARWPGIRVAVRAAPAARLPLLPRPPRNRSSHCLLSPSRASR